MSDSGLVPDCDVGSQLWCQSRITLYMFFVIASICGLIYFLLLYNFVFLYHLLCKGWLAWTVLLLCCILSTINLYLSTYQYLAHWAEYFQVAESPSGVIMGYSKLVYFYPAVELVLSKEINFCRVDLFGPNHVRDDPQNLGLRLPPLFFCPWVCVCVCVFT